MANVSDCGELHDEMWRLSDINKLFARVPLPDDVISVPELDDALLATHCAVESAKVCYAGLRLEDNTLAGSPESRFVDILRLSHRSLLRRKILCLSVQK